MKGDYVISEKSPGGICKLYKIDGSNFGLNLDLQWQQLLWLLCLSCLYLAPVLAVFLKSFGIGSGGFTLQYYEKFFQTPLLF